jgi:excisionase family DNA binding protein
MPEMQGRGWACPTRIGGGEKEAARAELFGSEVTVERIGVRTEATVRRLLSVDEVAQILGVPVKTLYQWRHKGVGPVGLRVGRHLRYRAADVSEWIDRRAAEEAISRRG